MTLFNQYINKAILLSTLLLAGCVGNIPFHQLDPSSNNCSDPTLESCLKSYYQHYPEYDIAFAEFTERGNVFNSRWIDNILQKIETHEKESGVVVIVFVHGWQHNADEEDKNVRDFKAVLAALSDSESFALGSRKLVGLYVGWRGASIKVPLIENTTYWDRKAVAEEVGKGGVTKLLLALENIDKKHKRNVLVTIGHSFGAAIVVSAVTDVLIDRVTDVQNDRTADESIEKTEAPIAKSIGDTIIVLNPAIEANQTLPLVEAAISREYTEKQSPLFISISSDADSATHYAFPIGQSVELLFAWKQANLERDYYHDRIESDDPILKEENLDTTAVGNFAPFLTHYLSSSKAGDGSPPTLSFDSCEDNIEQCVPKGVTRLSGHPTISPLPTHYPFYFIKTDDSVMNGHNDIFNCTMRTFVISLVNDIMSRQHNSYILNDSTRLGERFRMFYPKDRAACE